MDSSITPDGFVPETQEQLPDGFVPDKAAQMAASLPDGFVPENQVKPGRKFNIDKVAPTLLRWCTDIIWGKS